MYIYKIGYSTYEPSEYRELYHKGKISKEDFEQMFIDATVELLLNRRKDASIIRHYEEGEERSVYNIFTEKQYTSFMYILDNVADIMVEKHGFKKIEYTQQIDVEGWGGVVESNRSFSEDDVILNKIRNKFWKTKNR